MKAAMTPDQLRAIGPALYAPDQRYRWQTLLADELGVSPRTIRSWLAGTRKIRLPMARLIIAAQENRK